MTGTEKQIATATDIIKKTVERIDGMIAKYTAEIEKSEALAKKAGLDWQDQYNRNLRQEWEEDKEDMIAMLTNPAVSAEEVIEYEKEDGFFPYLCACFNSRHSM